MALPQKRPPAPRAPELISQHRGPPTRLGGRCPWVLLGSFLLDCPCEYLLSCLRLSAPSTPPRSTQRLRHLRPQRLRQLLQLRQDQRLQRHDTCGERPGGNARAVPTCSSHRAANDNGHPSAGRLALLSAASARAVAYYELAELRAAQCATTQPTPRHPVPAVAQQCVARCSLTCHGWQHQPHWVVYYVLCSIRH